MDVTLPAITAWERGRLDARAGPRKLLFGQMYEDAAIEAHAFPPGGRVFCIASAGCTAMVLARHHDVVAVDINPVQLAYVQRRLTGAPPERGSADRILALARTLAPLAGWTRKAVKQFLDLDDPKEQLLFWHRHLNTRRFRAAFDFLFSGTVLRSIYSPSLLDCLPSNFGAVMRNRMERCFKLHPNATNPYARALLLGETAAPRNNAALQQIELVCADAAQFLESQPVASFTGFSLSNILDGANLAYAHRLLAAIQHAAAPGALAVLRSIREPPLVAPTNHAAEDRAMLWGIVDVRPADALGTDPLFPLDGAAFGP
jgi:S-adenosylmethionine:diacylglycerol 3-amino-3-carboxypropyl transferase